MTDALQFSFDIACPQQQAFDLWTARASSWWPADHSVSGEHGLDVVFEGRVDGRVYERTPSGAEHEWGRVTEWEPPARLAFTWHFRATPGDFTLVEIRFVRTDDRRTKVEIEHTGWERLGEGAALRRDRNRDGWAEVLPHFVEAAGKEDGSG